MTKNAHGLERRPSQAICRQLRQEAGFGCVVCGLAIGDYEHIAPEFKDATEHDPDRMAFLCIQCHGKVTRKFWSKEKIWKAKSDPYALRVGHASEEFDIGNEWPKISIGSFHMTRCENLITIDGKSVFGISPPEEDGGPFRLSARFTDPDGNVLLCITDNVWEANAANWDVEASGGRILFRDSDGKAVIAIRAQNQSLVFETLQFSAEGFVFKFHGSGFYVDTAYGEKYVFNGADLIGFASAILVEGPHLVIGADGRDGWSARLEPVTINPHLTSQEQMREIFQRKILKYGLEKLASPSMGGSDPTTYSTALCVIM